MTRQIGVFLFALIVCLIVSAVIFVLLIALTIIPAAGMERVGALTAAQYYNGAAYAAGGLIAASAFVSLVAAMLAKD